MPGFYLEGEYDLAGFIVGVVERDRIISGQRRAGWEIASSGLPSRRPAHHGYSLARKLLFEIAG